MAKRQEYEVVSYISIGGAPPVPFDSLTAAERAAAVERMMNNMSRALSDYYSAHPEEAEPLIEKYGN